MKRAFCLIPILILLLASPLFAQGDLTSLMRGESAIPDSPTAARFFDLTLEPLIKSIGDDYLLGAGDILTINLGNVTADEVQQQVSSQGNVMLPTVGKVKIAGMTVKKAEKAMTKACSKYFRNLDVKIQINQVRKVEVYLVGQVHQPGVYLCYAGTTLSQFMQLTDRLIFGNPSIAGYGERQFYNRTNPLFTHILPEGSIRRIQLKRSDEVQTVDLADVIIMGNTENDPALTHGDTIYIPRVGKSIVVKGGVNPGRYEVLKGDTLDDIVKISGGFNSMYTGEIITVDDLSGIERTSRQVNTVSNSYLDDESLFEMKNDMVVRLPQAQEFVYMIGAVPYPGQKDYVEGITLMDYLGMSGGFIPGNQMGDTQIWRKVGFEKKRRIINIDLKKVLKGEEIGDIAVYPGDIVYIPIKNQQYSGPAVVGTLLGIGGLMEKIWDNE